MCSLTPAQRGERGNTLSEPPVRPPRAAGCCDEAAWFAAYLCLSKGRPTIQSTLPPVIPANAGTQRKDKATDPPLSKRGSLRTCSETPAQRSERGNTLSEPPPFALPA